MDEKILSADLSNVNKQLDDLSKKMDNVASSTSKVAQQNTEMNTSMMAMNQAITNLGGALPSLTSGFQMYKTVQQQVNVACEQFALNPVGATIQLIAIALAVINTVIDKFKGEVEKSDELSRKWTEAMAAFDPILKIFNQTLTLAVGYIVDFVTQIVKAVEWVAKLADKVKNFFHKGDNEFEESMNKAKEMAKLKNEIDEEDTRLREEKGEMEARQGKLREEIANAEGEAKIKLLNDLKEEIKAQKEAEIALNNKKIALMEYQQSLGPTSQAEKKALAELKGETKKLEGELSNQNAQIDKQIQKTSKSVASTVKASNKTMVDDAKKKAEEAKQKALKEVEDYIKKREKLFTDNDKKYNNTSKLIGAQRKLEDSQLKLAKANEFTIGVVKQNRLNQDIKNEQEHYNEQVKILEDTLKNEQLTAEQRVNISAKLAELKNEHEVNTTNFQTEQNQIKLENDKTFYANLKEDATEFSGFVKSNTEEEQKRKEEERQKEFDQAFEAIDYTADYIASSFDKLSRPEQMVVDSIHNITASFLDLKENWNKMDKPSQKARASIQAVAGAIQAATSIVNGYMEAEQQRIKQQLDNGEITEEEARKEFERTKKIQIVMATISMMGGIAEAIARGMELGPILGPIVGSLNATAVAVAGALQIANIKKTTIEGGGNTEINAPSMPTIQDYGASVNPLLNEDYDLASIGQNASIQGNSVIQDQRVYIVEDDIQQSNRRVEVRENTTTF